MDEINPLSKFVSPLFSYIFGEDTTSVPGSFAVQSGDHFRSWDHLLSNLGIICSARIICGPGSFEGLYIISLDNIYLSVIKFLQSQLNYSCYESVLS